MAATEKELTELIKEHEAIRSHIGFLTKSLGKLAAESSLGAEKSAKLKDQITLYRWLLYDFREAIQRHIEVDERIFGTLLGTSSMQDMTGEHATIQKQVDIAIRLAENAVYNKLGRESLNKCASAIRETVEEVCKLIVAHVAQEDRLLKVEQKRS